MSSRFAWSQVIASNIEPPGTPSTPPMMTRPGSPAACASTASMIGPTLSRPGTSTGYRPRCASASSRATSRRASRSAMSRRRSWSCFPRASASSTLARPRWEMYRRSGTIVWPLALARPRSWSISDRWRRSFRIRFGSWLYRLPPSNGAMCAPTSHASPCSIRAYASERFAFPARSDLISVPVRTMPASNVSSMVKSWRALRLRATVCSSRIGRLLAGPWWSFGGPRPRGHRTEDSHERRPDAGRRPSAYPPTGCPTRRASPARWCSYFDLSLHITSFRSVKPYPMSVTCARARSRASRRSRRSPIRDSGRGGPEDLERLGEVRVGARRKRIGQGHHHIRREADRVDPALRRGQPASDGQLEGATLPAELLPLLDGALPEGLLTDERRALRVLERSGDDLARRRAAVIDHDDDLDLRVGGDPIAERFGRDLGALRILLPEEHAGADELARDLPRRRDVAAGVAAEVEDDLCPTGGQMRLQGVHHGV